MKIRHTRTKGTKKEEKKLQNTTLHYQ